MVHVYRKQRTIRIEPQDAHPAPEAPGPGTDGLGPDEVLRLD